MADWILYLIVRLEAFTFRLLPLRFSLWTARAFGSLIYYTMGRRKTVAYANLRAAFRGKYAPAQLDNIIKSVYRNIAQSYTELLKFPQIDDNYIRKYIKIEGRDKIKKSVDAFGGTGVIFLTAHFGNWELSSLIGSDAGYKMNVLARWQKMEKLNGYLNKMRGSKGANVIFKQNAVEEILDSLNRKEAVGILSDQDGGKKGELVEFLGRRASTPKGAAHFSLRTHAPIFPVLIVREHGPYHRIVVEDDISVMRSDSLEKDVHEILQRFADVLAKYVTKYPGQWLWLHKRWKSTPTKYVLVLNDGKAGHYKQSLALSRLIRKMRSEKGYSADDTLIETAEVKFRSGAARVIFDLGSKIGFGIHALSGCFEGESYEALRSSYADYVVSCGASLAGVNLSLKRELGAKSLVIMKPNIFSVKDFDIAVIPVHDMVKPAKNTVFTKGTVTGLDAGTLRGYADKLDEKVKIKKDKVIGVLIGGDSRDYVLEKELAVQVMDEVLSAAGQLDAEVLVTTSRRTQRAVEFALKERYGKADRIRMLLIANDGNFEGAIEGILGLSDLLVVSGESVAMLTEAISSDKPVIAFMPRKMKPGPATKIERSVGNLEKENLIKVSEAPALKEDIVHYMGRKQAGIQGADLEAIRAVLGKII
ncbi:MAG: ELM1/GtrOC1 family putative glycosyltransferase [Candidatus Omnitrophota bacterium]